MPCDELKCIYLPQKDSRENFKKCSVVMESHTLEDKRENGRTTVKELRQTASIPANSKLRLTKIKYKFLSK